MSDAGFARQHARTRRFTLGAPRSFRVAPSGKHILFLRSTGGDDPINRLWIHDVASNSARIVADPDELLGDKFRGQVPAGPDPISELPPEERARRERARESGEGIVSFATDRDVTGAVFALAGRLYTTDLGTGETARLPSVEGVFDPRPDPTGGLVAYVACGDLRVVSLDGGDKLVAGSDDPDISHGMAEFVAAEEMGRSRGFWWGPDGKALLVARVDTSDVPRWNIASPIDPAAAPRQIRYPHAGAANAQVSLAMHPLDGTPVEVRWNPDLEWEYLSDASWGPRLDATLVVQTRDQRTCAVLAVNGDGSCREVYRWSDQHWVEIVRGVPCWVGSRLLTVEDRGAARRLVLDAEPLTSDDLQVRRVVQADDAGVLVVASIDATEQQLVHVALDGTTTPLTNAAGLHTAATGGSVVVNNRASMDHDGWLTTVIRDGEQVGTIENLAEEPCLTPAVFFHQTTQRSLHSAVVLPHGADRDTPLPVLLDPYGGPHAQRVLKARANYGVSQWFADQGFAVVVTDGAGTPARGPGFEREVWGDLAAPVLDDQLAALDALAGDYPGMDLDRVGIRGWSFGGYLAALAVLRRPDRFHAAVAGAPVTDWLLYDTHYTERYLGHPDSHPEHYARTDLTAEAASLTRPLLLIHGLADDNVVAAHTLKLSQALLEAGRPHQVLPLSGVTHMTPQEVVAENLLLLQSRFLLDALVAP